VAVADGVPALYATAEVVGDRTYAGQHLAWRSGDKQKQRPYVGRVGLLGLTPKPTWWVWFGGGYLPLVQERLDNAPAAWRVSDSQAGRLVELAPEPTPVEGLGRAWFPRELRQRDGSWGSKPARVRPAIPS
jgi:hypothetical protein